MKQKYKIESMSYGPFAISHSAEGEVVFIENACPEDEVEAEVYDKRKGFSYASITELVKESSLRNPDPNCKLHKICGSCQWQHIDYNEQLKFKKKNLEDLVRESKIDFNEELPDVLGMEEPWNYRNKVCYPVKTVKSTGRLQAGYFKRNSNELINIKFCPIQYSIFDEIIDKVKDLCSDKLITDEVLRHILLRSNNDKSQVLLCLIVRKKELFPETHASIKEIFKTLTAEFPQLKTCTINYNTLSTNVILGEKTETVIGSGYIFETVNDLTLRISTTSFFQVNTKQFSKIIDLIVPELKADSKILDAYCGAGIISLALAKKLSGLDITGIEVVASAIKDANKNAEINDVKAHFIEGKVEDQILHLFQKAPDARLASSEQAELTDVSMMTAKNKRNVADGLLGVDVVIVNPPRKGCTNKVLDALGEMAVKKIIYVSCNPSTLTRDIKRLEGFGYKLKSFQGVDMFPHTYHVETLAILETTS